VLLVIWLGLRLAESVARNNGICLLDTNDQCEYEVLNDIIWLSIAAGAATLSINGMHKVRVERDSAKKKLVAMREPWLNKAKRQVRPLVWGIVIVLAFVTVIVVLADKFD